MTEWLQLAKEAFDKSTSYIDTNYRKMWEDSLRHFQSKHASGSKYNKAAYRYRSKMFRPKTRSAIRNNEAAVAAAFFTNKDAVSIEAQNPSNPFQQASAAINQELLNIRLDEHIPWFLTCVGASQDAMTVGAVCSCQEWVYKTKDRKVARMENGVPVVDEQTGQIVVDTVKKVKKDSSDVRLIPIEYIRIDPAADWRDPVNSSPYFIEMMPMYVKDVKARMEEDENGEGKWIKLDDAKIKACKSHINDTTKMVRHDDREDQHDAGNSDTMGDYDTVWVHRNIIEVNGEDYVYYTLGTDHLLSKPKIRGEVFLHDIRPYVIGISVIETHKALPNGIAELGRPTQQEINENVNQRSDNVKLVLNKRYIAKRGAQVDVRSLTRNVAGSVTLANDPKGDVNTIDFNDVTASAYQEQDRLNLDFDELVGTFSASTIQSNRKMNETVGGMSMLRGSVNALVEYVVRTFSETWAAPVLKQLVKLEQAYESDETLLAIAGEKAQLYQKFGVDRITDELLNQNLTFNLDVGISSTDPIQRVNIFVMAMRMVKELMVEAPPGLKINEVIKEVFGKIGYKSADRFFDMEGEDSQQMAMVQEMMQRIQQLEAALNDKGADRQAKLIETKMKEDNQNKRTEAELNTRMAEKAMDLMNPVSGEQQRFAI